MQQAGNKVTKASIMEELAKKAFVSTEAIKNWMYGYNGPSDMEQVKSLGDYFQVDYHQLLKMEEGQMAESDKQIQIIALNNVQEDYTSVPGSMWIRS